VGGRRDCGEPEDRVAKGSRTLNSRSSYPFRVEKMGSRGEIGRVLVYADNPLIARAAFKAAVEQYPNSRIRLRNRALFMEERKPK
jgi:hypothetical protein